MTTENDDTMGGFPASAISTAPLPIDWDTAREEFHGGGVSFVDETEPEQETVESLNVSSMAPQAFDSEERTVAKMTTWADLVALDHGGGPGSAAHEYIQRQRQHIIDQLLESGIQNEPNGAEFMRVVRSRPFPYRIRRKIMRRLNPPSIMIIEHHRDRWGKYRWHSDPCRPKCAVASEMGLPWRELEHLALQVLGEDPSEEGREGDGYAPMPF
ncbi:MAG: hypothetical protein JRE40_02370 [Deltaproteobacteria bacterium]|nr:hypothetical protein [Deltaproteobacteria bacterium]